MRRAIPVILVLIFCFNATAYGSEKKIEKRFSGIKAVDIETVSGDCTVKKHSSDEVLIEVIYDSSLGDVVEFKFSEHSGSLSMEEDWEGSGSGNIKWMIMLPADTDVEFSSASGDFSASGISGDLEGSAASGDFELENLGGSVEISVASGDIDIRDSSGDIEISTASGDINIENCRGDIELSAASGDIEASGIESSDIDMSAASGDIDISEAKGRFDLSVASGDVEAEGIEITGDSDFSTASGGVRLILAASPGAGIDLSTASGDVLLDYQGNAMMGYFEFTARKGRGRIRAPYDFDNEEEFRKDGRTYLKKSFSREGDSPRIFLSTASGKVELKK